MPCFFHPATAPAAAPAGSVNAVPTSDKLYVDGVLQSPVVYKIGDSNYVKLRDVAKILSGTSKQFSVSYDAALGAVQVTRGQAYTPDGSELLGQASGSTTAAVSSNPISVDGVKATSLSVYSIDGNNYFKLRDLGQVLNFYVGWDAETGSVILSGNMGYMG